MRDLETLPLVTTLADGYPTDGLPRRRAIARAVEDQLAAGLDIVGDGHAESELVNTFAARVPGLRRGVGGAWEVESALDLPDAPVFVADHVFAREFAGGRAVVAAAVPGPLSLALGCRVLPGSPYVDSTDPALILRLAELLEREVAALIASGATVVQVYEPALTTVLGTTIPVELASDALRGLAATPQTAILRVGGDIRALADELLLLSFGVLAFDNTAVDNLTPFDAEAVEFGGTRLCAGVLDTRTPSVETVPAVRARVRNAIEHIPASLLWVAPDSGLARLPREAAREKLARLAQAVQDVRATL
jgi:methionine synthase II (cobalamin-independent)